jgi:hypothetical protein
MEEPACSHIRRLADVSAPKAAQDSDVEIRIGFDATDPPVGWAERAESDAADGGAPMQFTGWMELLQLLYELLAIPAERVAD